MKPHSRLSGLFGVMVVAYALTTLPGCELLGTVSNHDSDLAVSKRIWANTNTGAYRFTLFRGCFCVYGGEYEVVVMNDEIVDVIPAWDDQIGVPREDYHLFQTVDDIFEIIGNAYRNGADDIDIEYSAMGYPALVTIDYIVNAVDDELSLRVSDLHFTPLDRGF